ncbi:MAG: hypothetical protein K1X92_06560 [Bacteroidia bacterium]|nr:hypothetical protein [Bacteroidia bacterium]
MKYFCFLLIIVAMMNQQKTVAQSSFCNPKAVFAVDDYLLSQKVGKKTLPEVKPEYEGGTKFLTEFVQSKLSDLPEEQNQTFFASIAFSLNCKGQASAFELLGKHEGIETMYCERALEAIQELPSKWLPAKSKGRFIDCYGVLILSFYQGKLIKVALK